MARVPLGYEASSGLPVPLPVEIPTRTHGYGFVTGRGRGFDGVYGYKNPWGYDPRVFDVTRRWWPLLVSSSCPDSIGIEMVRCEVQERSPPTGVEIKGMDAGGGSCRNGGAGGCRRGDHLLPASKSRGARMQEGDSLPLTSKSRGLLVSSIVAK